MEDKTKHRYAFMPLGCNHFWDSYDTPEEAIEEAQKEYDKNGKLDDFDIFYDKQVTNDKFKTNIIEIRPTQEIDVNMGHRACIG